MKTFVNIDSNEVCAKLIYNEKQVWWLSTLLTSYTATTPTLEMNNRKLCQAYFSVNGHESPAQFTTDVNQEATG
jgi:hypothetical protein